MDPEDNKSSLQALHDSARTNDLKTLLSLLDNTNINSLLHGRTLLHSTVFWGHSEMTTYLLKQGADVNARTNNGETPLHIAVLRNRVNIARILLDFNADVNRKNKEGYTPLNLARKKGLKDITALLLKSSKPSSEEFHTGFFKSISNIFMSAMVFIIALILRVMFQVFSPLGISIDVDNMSADSAFKKLLKYRLEQKTSQGNEYIIIYITLVICLLVLVVSKSAIIIFLSFYVLTFPLAGVLSILEARKRNWKRRWLAYPFFFLPFINWPIFLFMYASRIAVGQKQKLVGIGGIFVGIAFASAMQGDFERALDKAFDKGGLLDLLLYAPLVVSLPVIIGVIGIMMQISVVISSKRILKKQTEHKNEKVRQEMRNEQAKKKDPEAIVDESVKLLEIPGTNYTDAPIDSKQKITDSTGDNSSIPDAASGKTTDTRPCPKCGHSVPAKQDECPNCQVYISKYEIMMQKRASMNIAPRQGKINVSSPVKYRKEQHNKKKLKKLIVLSGIIIILGVIITSLSIDLYEMRHMILMSEEDKNQEALKSIVFACECYYIDKENYPERLYALYKPVAYLGSWKNNFTYEKKSDNFIVRWKENNGEKKIYEHPGNGEIDDSLRTTYEDIRPSPYGQRITHSKKVDGSDVEIYDNLGLGCVIQKSSRITNTTTRWDLKKGKIWEIRDGDDTVDIIENIIQRKKKWIKSLSKN